MTLFFYYLLCIRYANIEKSPPIGFVTVFWGMPKIFCLFSIRRNGRMMCSYYCELRYDYSRAYPTILSNAFDVLVECEKLKGVGLGDSNLIRAKGRRDRIKKRRIRAVNRQRARYKLNRISCLIASASWYPARFRNIWIRKF